uniref:Uncharacterized protein n=1 Tax=Oryza sativa subsp. japonica TaxID=39947 RepID=Q6F375_ORYSJ|nr:hypothetical protein [Oryza sativa Japonica Group]
MAASPADKRPERQTDQQEKDDHTVINRSSQSVPLPCPILLQSFHHVPRYNLLSPNWSCTVTSDNAAAAAGPLWRSSAMCMRRNTAARERVDVAGRGQWHGGGGECRAVDGEGGAAEIESHHHHSLCRHRHHHNLFRGRTTPELWPQTKTANERTKAQATTTHNAMYHVPLRVAGAGQGRDLIWK